MKTVTSAMMLLLVSTLATANEPQQKAADQSLVIAYNAETATVLQENPVVEPTADRAQTERALSETLGAVSASLSVELDEKIASATPGFAW